MAKMNEQTFAAMFKESPIRRAKYVGLQRNVSWAIDHETTSAEGVLRSSKADLP